MTTTVDEACIHRFTRVIEGGGTYCHNLPGHERNMWTARIRLPIKQATGHTKGRRDFATGGAFRRNEFGTRLADDLSAPEVRGSWPGQVFPTGDVWEPGTLAVLSLKEGVWDAHFGGWWAGFGDDSLLVRDATMAAKYLDVPAGERFMDFASPPSSDLERAADALGLRLPRMAARPGHVESYGRFKTLAEYITALAPPKSAGPTNLRATSNRVDELLEGQ